MDEDTRRARSDVAHAVRRAASNAGLVGMPLGMWCGNGDYATMSPETHDRAGRRALDELDAAIPALLAARARLADALGLPADIPDAQIAAAVPADATAEPIDVREFDVQTDYQANAVALVLTPEHGPTATYRIRNDQAGDLAYRINTD